MSARRWLLAGGIGLVVLGAVWLWSGRERLERKETAAATAARPVQPRLAQRDYPSAPEAAAPAPARVEPGAGRAAPVQPPPPAQVIKVADDRPAPSPQLASGWAIDYRDAVCACHTRACVGDLQGMFIRKLGAVVQGDEQDGERYTEATRAAIKCYNALPEGS